MLLFLSESVKRIGKEVFQTEMPDLESAHVRTDLQHNENMAQGITIDLRDTARIQIILWIYFNKVIGIKHPSFS